MLENIEIDYLISEKNRLKNDQTMPRPDFGPSGVPPRLPLLPYAALRTPTASKRSLGVLWTHSMGSLPCILLLGCCTNWRIFIGTTPPQGTKNVNMGTIIHLYLCIDFREGTTPIAHNSSPSFIFPLSSILDADDLTHDPPDRVLVDFTELHVKVASPITLSEAQHLTFSLWQWKTLNKNIR